MRIFQTTSRSAHSPLFTCPRSREAWCWRLRLALRAGVVSAALCLILRGLPPSWFRTEDTTAHVEDADIQIGRPRGVLTAAQTVSIISNHTIELEGGSSVQEAAQGRSPVIAVGHHSRIDHGCHSPVMRHYRLTQEQYAASRDLPTSALNNPRGRTKMSALYSLRPSRQEKRCHFMQPVDRIRGFSAIHASPWPEPRAGQQTGSTSESCPSESGAGSCSEDQPSPTAGNDRHRARQRVRRDRDRQSRSAA